MDYFIAGLNEQILAQDICKKLQGTMLNRKISYFTGGELNIHIENKNLTNKKIYILQSLVGNANDRIIELCLLADAIKNLGGENIIAIIPYFGYARQDKTKKCTAFSLRCLIKIIETTNIKKIITVDLHNPQSTELFNLPIVNLPTTPIFEKVIKNKKQAVIIAPDLGASLRAQELANMLGAPLIIAKKERTNSGKIKIIDIPEIETITDKECYLVDDILDTGKTICYVALKLKKFKPKAIYALISHGLFGKGAAQAIEKSFLNQIYVTNSINCVSIKSSKISILTLSSMISDFLKNSEK